MLAFIVTMEKQMLEFLQSDQGRVSLPVMPSSKRALVHEMAANHGIDSQAFDMEPKRHVELFKKPFGRLTLPSPALSKAVRDPDAARQAYGDSLEALRARPCLVFTQIAAGLRLRSEVSKQAIGGGFSISWVKEDEAVVAFERTVDMQNVFEELGRSRDKFVVFVAKESYFDRATGKQTSHQPSLPSQARDKVTAFDEDGFVIVQAGKKAESKTAPNKASNTPVAACESTPKLTATGIFTVLNDEDKNEES